jgi:hypothetical protein
MGRKKMPPAIIDLDSDEMCLVCGIRPRGSVMKHNRPNTLYCGSDCSKAAQRNFKRRTSGDTVGKLMLTLKSLGEEYGEKPITTKEWIENLNRQYKTSIHFDRPLMLTNMVRSVINPETLEVQKNAQGGNWKFRYLGGETISEWLAPSARAKFDALRNEIGGTAAVSIDTFAVEFDDWAKQEMMTHGQEVSFKEWAEEEGEKHGDMDLTDWAKEEESSHDERYKAEDSEDLKYQDATERPWVYHSGSLTQFHRPYLTKMVIPLTENTDSFLSNGKEVSIPAERTKWYYSDLKQRIEFADEDSPYSADLDPEIEEMDIRINPITGQDHYTFELEGVIQGVVYGDYDEAEAAKYLDEYNWSEEGEARQVMDYALGDFLSANEWKPASYVSVGLEDYGPEGALKHMGNYYPTMVVKKAILRNSLGEIVEMYEMDSTDRDIQDEIHPDYLFLFDEDYRQYGAEGTPSRDNDRVAVGDRVRSYDFVIGDTLLRDDSYIEGTVTKIGEWEYCPCGTDHVFIVVEEVVRQGKQVSATGMDMAFPVITESFITVLDTEVRDSEMLYAPEYYVHSPDDLYGPYYSLEEAEEAVERLMRRGIEIRGITKGQDNWMSESWKTCVMCGEPASFTVEDTPVGPRNFCCERCYAQYMGLPVEEPGYYGLEAEDWNWGGDPEGPLAKALRKVKNNPKKIKPLELVRLPKSETEEKESETWDGPFGIETRTPTGSFKKWEKVKTYDKLVEKLTEMFENEGFSPYALDVYAEQMPRVQMTATGPVVVNDRKMLLATYKYGKWESGPWAAYLPKP